MPGVRALREREEQHVQRPGHGLEETQHDVSKQRGYLSSGLSCVMIAMACEMM